jgi:hypothetical protein
MRADRETNKGKEERLQKRNTDITVGEHDKNRDPKNRYSEQGTGQSRPTQNNGRPR